MARGRMISSSLGGSRKFSRLETNEARLVYCLVLPHADAYGRIEADTDFVKGTMLSRVPIDVDALEEALADLHRVGLIRLYEVDGFRYAEIVDFDEHNRTDASREAQTSIPTPDGHVPQRPPRKDSDAPSQTQGKTKPRSSRASVQTKTRPTADKVAEKEKVKENLEKEVLSTPSSTITKPTSNQALAATPPRDRTHDPGQFMEAWNQNRGRLPEVTTMNAKRKTAIRALVKEHGPDKALDLLRDATRAVAHDDFWLERQYGLDTLLGGNKVLQRAEQWRNGHVQLGPANSKLAGYAATVASAIGGLDDQPN